MKRKGDRVENEQVHMDFFNPVRKVKLTLSAKRRKTRRNPLGRLGRAHNRD